MTSIIKFVIVCAVIALSSQNGVASEASKKKRSYIDRVCPLYDDILKDGMCSKYLNGKRISLDKYTIYIRNLELKRFYKGAIPFVQMWLRNGKSTAEFLSTFLGDCMDDAVINKLVRTIQSPSLAELNRCIENSKEITCYYFYPLCLHKYTDNNYGYRVYDFVESGLCRDTCFEHLEYCNTTFTFLQAAAEVKNRCYKINKLNQFGLRVIDCSSLKKPTMSRVEMCQRILKAEKQNEKETKRNLSACYYGNGFTYKGKTNVTKSKKACAMWTENEFLFSNINYTALDRNYCRNPQSYGISPWCYVNMTSREWEYCDIPKCEDGETNFPNESLSIKQFFTIYLLEILVAAVCFMLAVFFIVLVSLFLVKKRRKVVTESIAEYAEVAVENHQQIAGLLNVIAPKT